MLRCCVFVAFIGARAAAADPPESSRQADAAGAGSRASPSAAQGRRKSLLVTSPFAAAAVRAALSAARQADGWARLSSLEARAHSSALLPELVFRVTRNTDQSLRLSPTIDDPYNYSTVGGAGLWLEGRLIWHLDRLVFNTHELGIERLRLDHADRTGRLVSKVLATLFAWQRAALRARDPNADEEDRAQAELAEAEAAIMLDELTAGWFSRELARRRDNE